MKVVVEDYEVNKNTMALLSAANIDFATIVMEQHRMLYVKKPPLKLIQTACLDGGATYEGRRKAMCYHTGAKQKVPIPINPRDHIFAFPTLSPEAFNCNWIFYNHVKSIQSVPSTHEQPAQSIITFQNNQQVTLPESVYTLEKQMQRTAICILLFNPPAFT
ncbi:competence protein ComK [Calidifontibacillus oryziterrae]|uniref:competence protein ComK n=1 Tax=Calidifontibacillus oryziterrae TaxID=1191699 RepID=UPI000315A118|nr:competence protein ComK [Calidifontibacillus oryziterrae]